MNPGIFGTKLTPIHVTRTNKLKCNDKKGIPSSLSLFFPFKLPEPTNSSLQRASYTTTVTKGREEKTRGTQKGHKKVRNRTERKISQKEDEAEKETNFSWFFSCTIFDGHSVDTEWDLSV